MRDFLQRQWFLVCLAATLGLGFCWPEVFEPFANAQPLRNSIVFLVLLVMALPLEASSIVGALRRPGVALLASLVNMGLLPLAAWPVAGLLADDLATGLLVTAAVPCTLASAAVWTRRAGGDDTVALMVTVLTNATCFLTTPFWLALTTGGQIDEGLRARLSWMPLRLAILVVLPMALGQLLHRHAAVAAWAVRRRRWLATCAQLGILSMVLAGATQCGLRLSDMSWQDSVRLGDFGLMLLVVLGLHLAMLWLGLWLARLLRCGWPDQVAVAFSGSQKTLMVGLHVAITYFGGLTVLPMVAYHVIQLLVDTIIADRMRGRTGLAAGDDPAKQPGAKNQASE
jgi:sodium/bile acid cotransporter 7